ncbi:hypothetical protein B484DRAFT_439088, partial [Ochromonadaceae sp. CCMP2298]
PLAESKGDGDMIAKLSMNTLSSAAAMNLGIVTADTMEQKGPSREILVDDILFSFTAHYDPRYENADLAFCIVSARENVSKKPVHYDWLPLCLAMTGDLLVLPLFTPIDPGCIGCDGAPEFGAGDGD